MSFVADFIGGVVSAVTSIVVDIVTFDIGGLVDTAVGMVEGIVHTITHPTEDPFATIMLAFAVYSGYSSYTAEAAIATEATLAGEAAFNASLAEAGVTATTATASQIAIADIAAAASVDAMYLQAGASPGFWTGDIASPSGNIVRSGSQSLATGSIGTGVTYGTPLSGPSFNAAQLGASIGKTAAIDSVALASAGVAVQGSMYKPGTGELLEAGTTAAEAAKSARLYEATTLEIGTFGGVGAKSAAGSMTGWGGGGGITGVSSGNVFLDSLQSAWTDTTDFATENVDMSSDWAESESAWGDNFAEVIEETVESGKRTAKNFYRDVEERTKNFMDDPLATAEDYIEGRAQEKYPWISTGGKIPTTATEFFDLGVDLMASSFENWSPTIGYQAGGDPGSSTASSYPSFTWAETGILGDPFNLEGQDLALTVSGLASRLQQQQGLPLSQQQMGLPDPMGTDPRAFRQLDAPAEELQQLLNPSYAVNQYQQPMVSELVNQLNANSQVRGLAPSQEGISRGIAPLLSMLRQDNLAALNRGAGLDLEARAQGMGQRAGDITSQMGYQDIGTAADTARQNITLNSLLALAQMSKPTIIGGSTAQSSGTTGVAGSKFQGEVPVGNILSSGWDWLTDDKGMKYFTG